MTRSRMWRGALPGRNPGIRWRRARWATDTWIWRWRRSGGSSISSSTVLFGAGGAGTVLARGVYVPGRRAAVRRDGLGARAADEASEVAQHAPATSPDSPVPG